MFFGIKSSLLEDLETSKETAYAELLRRTGRASWEIVTACKKHLFLLFHNCFQNFSPIAWKGINSHTETMMAPNLTQITDNRPKPAFTQISSCLLGSWDEHVGILRWWNEFLLGDVGLDRLGQSQQGNFLVFHALLRQKRRMRQGTAPVLSSEKHPWHRVWRTPIKGMDPVWTHGISTGCSAHRSPGNRCLPVSLPSSSIFCICISRIICICISTSLHLVFLSDEMPPPFKNDVCKCKFVRNDGSTSVYAIFPQLLRTSTSFSMGSYCCARHCKNIFSSVRCQRVYGVVNFSVAFSIAFWPFSLWW